MASIVLYEQGSSHPSNIILYSLYYNDVHLSISTIYTERRVQHCTEGDENRVVIPVNINLGMKLAHSLLLRAS